MLHFFTLGTSLTAVFQHVQLEASSMQAFNQEERINFSQLIIKINWHILPPRLPDVHVVVTAIVLMVSLNIWKVNWVDFVSGVSSVGRKCCVTGSVWWQFYKFGLLFWQIYFAFSLSNFARSVSCAASFQPFTNGWLTERLLLIGAKIVYKINIVSYISFWKRSEIIWGICLPSFIIWVSQ